MIKLTANGESVETYVKENDYSDNKEAFEDVIERIYG